MTTDSGFEHKLRSLAYRLHLQMLWYGAAIASVVMMIAYYGWLEKPFLSYPILPFEVASEPHPGEAVGLNVKRCNSDAIERTYNVSHVLVSMEDPNRRVMLPPGPVEILPGCTTETSRVNVVPLGTLPGRYYVEGHAEVLGTIRTHSVAWRSAPFNVLPPEAKGINP